MLATIEKVEIEAIERRLKKIARRYEAKTSEERELISAAAPIIQLFSRKIGEKGKDTEDQRGNGKKKEPSFSTSPITEAILSLKYEGKENILRKIEKLAKT